MKLRTKIFSLFAALILLSTSTITIYSTLTQQQNSIEAELAKQRQVVSLLRNAVSGQYYSYINQQIFTVFSTRSDLAVKARILSNFARQLNFSDEELYSYLQRQQSSLNQVGLDLVVMQNNHLILPPHFKDVLKAVSVGGSTLTDTLRAVYENRRESYYQTFYSPQKTYGNYLSFCFSLPGYPGYTLAMTQNIDELIRLYSVNDNLIVEQLKSNFDELGSALEGAALLADAGSGKILLASTYRLPFLSLPDSLSTALQATDENQILDLQLNHRRTFISVSYYKPLNWYIIALRYADDVTGPALLQGRIILFIGAVVLLLSLLCSVWLARTLTGRLSRIARQAELISNSDLSRDNAGVLNAVQPLPGSDEVSALSLALYSMEQRLNQNIKNLMQTTEQKNRLVGELNAARQIQLGMLPGDADLPVSARVDMAAFLTPAKEVGGDFYDAFALDEHRICITIGDVSDKGVPAALFMSMTMSLMRSVCALGLTPAEAASAANAQLALRNPNMMFVTMFTAVLDLRDGTLTAVNAGHCPPLLCRPGGELQEIDEISGPAVGPLPGVTYTQYQLPLQPGDCLLLYTDGVSEAQNEQDEFFDTERLYELCRRQKFADLTPRQCIDTLLQAVLDFRGRKEQSDDITLLCLKRLPPPGDLTKD